MTGILKKVELFTNIAIIIVAILLSLVLIKSYLWRSNTLQSDARKATVSQKQIEIGDKINLPDIDWQKNRSTLLLILSTTCHYCTESAPFYQRIATERRDTQLIALIPQSVEEGQKYLKKLGLNIEQVKQTSLSSVGTSGTPTLILVDNRGVIADYWVGKLPTNKEVEVLAKLDGINSSD